jgi:HPt (histidine-containing phosphotransfer) domain-containing protein
MNFREMVKKSDLERDELMEILKLFIETSTSDLERLQSAIDEGDPQKAAIAVHSLRGLLRALG